MPDAMPLPDLSVSAPPPTALNNALAGSASSALAESRQSRQEYQKALQTDIIPEFREEQHRAGELRPPPPPPPQQMPQPQYRSPMDAWGSLAMGIAMIGSAFTRQPITNALNAGAAVNNAFHQGDAEAARQGLAQWRAQTEYAQKLYEYQDKTYRDALAGLKDDRAGTLAKLRILATAYNDPALKELAQYGQIQAIEQHLNLMSAQMGEIGKRAPGLEADSEMKLQKLQITQGIQAATQRGDQAEVGRLTQLLRDVEGKAETKPGGGLEGDILRQKDAERAAQGLPPMGADERAQALSDLRQTTRPPSVAQQHEDEKVSEVNATLDRGDDVIAEIQGAMRVGLGGRIMRPVETLGNLLGTSDDTTRNRIESDISQLRQLMTRLMNDRAIMTVRDQDAAAVIIRGLEPGSTIANTRDSIARAQDMLRQKYQAGLVRLKFMEAPKSSKTELPKDLPDPAGHPDGSVAKDPSGKAVAVIRNGQWASP